LSKSDEPTTGPTQCGQLVLFDLRLRERKSRFRPGDCEIREATVSPQAMTIDPIPRVSLISLGREHEATFQNLIQLYTHDFSELWAGTPRGDVQENGRFTDYPLSGFWERARWSANLILVGTTTAGFALVNDLSHIGDDVDANVAEFFVLRKFRRQGVGKSAARTMFNSRPGSWEVAVARRNQAARKFWKSVIESSPESRDVREIETQTERWTGPVFRFEWLAG
jgi:predicted acetyltransferase